MQNRAAWIWIAAAVGLVWMARSRPTVDPTPVDPVPVPQPADPQVVRLSILDREERAAYATTAEWLAQNPQATQAQTRDHLRQLMAAANATADDPIVQELQASIITAADGRKTWSPEKMRAILQELARDG